MLKQRRTGASLRSEDLLNGVFIYIYLGQALWRLQGRCGINQHVLKVSPGRFRRHGNLGHNMDFVAKSRGVRFLGLWFKLSSLWIGIWSVGFKVWGPRTCNM